MMRVSRAVVVQHAPLLIGNVLVDRCVQVYRAQWIVAPADHERRSRPYLDYLAPGIMAQSALFIAIFFGIQIIWERDAGVLTKLLATPTPRAALVTG